MVSTACGGGCRSGGADIAADSLDNNHNHNDDNDNDDEVFEDCERRADERVKDVDDDDDEENDDGDDDDDYDEGEDFTSLSDEPNYCGELDVSSTLAVSEYTNIYLNNLNMAFAGIDSDDITFSMFEQGASANANTNANLEHGGPLAQDQQQQCDKVDNAAVTGMSVLNTVYDRPAAKQTTPTPESPVDSPNAKSQKAKHTMTAATTIAAIAAIDAAAAAAADDQTTIETCRGGGKSIDNDDDDLHHDQPGDNNNLSFNHHNDNNENDDDDTSVSMLIDPKLHDNDDEDNDDDDMEQAAESSLPDLLDMGATTLDITQPVANRHAIHIAAASSSVLVAVNSSSSSSSFFNNHHNHHNHNHNNHNHHHSHHIPHHYHNHQHIQQPNSFTNSNSHSGIAGASACNNKHRSLSAIGLFDSFFSFNSILESSLFSNFYFYFYEMKKSKTIRCRCGRQRRLPRRRHRPFRLCLRPRVRMLVVLMSSQRHPRNQLATNSASSRWCKTQRAASARSQRSRANAVWPTHPSSAKVTTKTKTTTTTTTTTTT